MEDKVLCMCVGECEWGVSKFVTVYCRGLGVEGEFVVWYVVLLWFFFFWICIQNTAVNSKQVVLC